MTQVKQTTVKVLEAYTRDVGLGVARIDYGVMDEIGAVINSILEVKGTKTTYCRCLPLYPTDEGKNIIRIDGLIRNNAGVGVGATVNLNVVISRPAQKIRVTPATAIPDIDERYFADILEKMPISKTDSIMVPYFGGRLTFLVKSMEPDYEPLLITKDTVFEIAEYGKAKQIKQVHYAVSESETNEYLKKGYKCVTFFHTGSDMYRILAVLETTLEIESE